MPRLRNFILGLLALLAILAFAAGLWRLFAIRFEAGDVYPEYSTLNASPRGAKAVCESMDQLGRPVVARNFLPLLHLKESAGTTLVFAGAGHAFFGDDTPENFETFEGMVRRGLHVVAALDAESPPTLSHRGGPVTNPWDGGLELDPAKLGRKAKSAGGGEEEEEEEDVLPAGERWGFSFEWTERAGPEAREGLVVTPAPAPGGPPAVPRWFSSWHWTRLSPDWQTLASVGDHPVVIRRSFGEGSITLLSDATFLTNEALWRAPEPAFLVWLLGGQSRVVFDETLHGTQSDPGVMHLVRRYRLLGFFVGTAVLLGLVVWRASTSPVPPHESVESVQAGAIAGADGAQGFANLLRQSIAPKHLLRTCFTEWAKSPLVRRRYSDEAVAAVRDAVVAAESSKPIDRPATYRAIHHMLRAHRTR